MKPYGRKVAILGGARIPFARQNTAYALRSNQDMLTAALKGVVDKFQLHGERLGEVAAGAVLKHSRDFNLARESTLSSGLSMETPAYDLQQACGTSLETAITIGSKIALGQIESGIAGGVDTASDAPIGVSEGLRRILLEANRAKTTGQRLAAFAKFRGKDLMPLIPGVSEPRTKMSMGQHTEIMAKEWKIPREEQDQLALESHQKAAKAYDDGFFADLIVPYAGLERDNNLRADISLEKLASLGPAFDKKGGGTLTAGNSTPLTDGASAVLLASEDWAKARGLKPLARIVSSGISGVDPAIMGTGPIQAVQKALKKANWSIGDLDLIEANEAFAAQAISVNRELGWDLSKVNVNGGAIAIGHPIGASGAVVSPWPRWSWAKT